jgi:hypothetical protein
VPVKVSFARIVSGRRPLMIGSAAAVALALPATLAGSTAAMHAPLVQAARHSTPWPGTSRQTGSQAAAQNRSAIEPTAAQLEPTGTFGDQQRIAPDPAQWTNAKTIVQVVQQRKLPPYAAVISVATALQESALQNLTIAVDYDSLGLFQQRPSCGWGTPDQLIDPQYATNAFLDAMQKVVPDWQHLPLWQAAQTTQQSAFPIRYAQWQDQAADMVKQILGR